MKTLRNDGEQISKPFGLSQWHRVCISGKILQKMQFMTRSLTDQSRPMSYIIYNSTPIELNIMRQLVIFRFVTLYNDYQHRPDLGRSKLMLNINFTGKKYHSVSIDCIEVTGYRKT